MTTHIENKTHYENLLEYHIYRGAYNFDCLPLKDKKEVTAAYLQTICRSDQEELIGEALARISNKLPDHMINVFKHQGDKLDTYSEIIDQLSMAVMMEAEIPIDNSIEKIENRLITADNEKAQEQRLDYAKRARDLNSEMNMGRHLDIVNEIFGG
jgi:hypothetical protein